jgi:Zyg-11 protein homolog
LKFLGLYDTSSSACRRHDIPALAIAGDANEEQILLSAVMYQDRHEMLTKVLNDLYHLLRFENCTQIDRALNAVLVAMDKHIGIKHIQISGSATLFYIVKSKEKVVLGSILKNHIIRTLLNGMSAHLNDDTMMRNGCLTLCQFTIPGDVVSDSSRDLTRIYF